MTGKELKIHYEIHCNFIDFIHIKKARWPASSQFREKDLHSLVYTSAITLFK